MADESKSVESDPSTGSEDSFLRLAARAPAAPLHYFDLDGDSAVVLAPPATSLLELPVVPREVYAIQGEYARGGFGRVLLAFDRRLGRKVAIKELLAPTTDSCNRFVSEALVTARLQHPAIVAVHEAGRWPDGGFFYAMKLVSGRPLSVLMRERPAFADRLCLLPSVLTATEAVAYAHSQRVIHRDLKPSNVVIGDFGETVVIDWGLAQVLGDESQTGAAVRGSEGGTPAYMAPEQARGEPVDARADVYALGAVLYTVLAGAPPYQGRSAAAVLDQVRRGPPMTLRQRQRGVSEELLAIIETAMAPQAAVRYSTAQALAADLRRYLNGQLVPVYRYSALDLLTRFVRRHRAAVLAATVGLVLTLTTAGVALRRVVAEQVRAQTARGLAAEEMGLRAELLAQQPGQEVAALLEGIRAAAPALLEQRQPATHAAQGLLSAVASGRRVRPLYGHTGAITHAEFSRDGSLVLSSATDGTVRLWDAETGRQLQVLQDPAQSLRWAAFAPGGERIITVGTDRWARLWDRDGHLLRTYEGSAPVLAMALFSPDGTRLLLVSGSGTSRSDQAELWDATAGRLLARLTHTELIMSASFSPDGTQILTGSRDRTACLWDARDGRLLRTLGPHVSELNVTAFSPDWRRILTVATRHSVHLWDATTGRPLRVIPGSAGSAVVARFTPDGSRLVVAGTDQSVRFWDVQTGQVLGALAEQSKRITDLAFSPDGDRLITNSHDGSARIWDGSTGQLLSVLQGHHTLLSSVAFSPNGRFILTASRDGTLRLYHGDSGSRVSVLRGHAAPLRWSSFSPDGQLALTTDQEGEIRFWNGWTGRLLRVAHVHQDDVVRGVFSPDGRWAGTRSVDGTLCIWDRRTLSLFRTLRVPGWHILSSLAFSPDGRRVAANGAQGAYLWDVESGAQVASLAGHTDAVVSVAFSRNGQRLVTSSMDHTARLWEGHTGAPIAVLRGHERAVSSATFSPDSQLVATAGDDRTVRLWEADSGHLKTVLRGHEDEVWYATFSPDSTRLVSGSVDRTIRLWNVDTGQPLTQLLGHVAEINFAMFSPDGTRLVSTSLDQTVRLWDGQTGRPLRQLIGHSDWVEWASFSPDGTRILTASFDRTARLWDGHTGLPLEPRAAAGLLIPLYADEEAGPPFHAATDSYQLSRALSMACRLLQHRPEFSQVEALCADSVR